MPNSTSLESIQTRIHDAEASLTRERARAARLQREVVELEALYRSERVARARIDALQAQCEALAAQLSMAAAVASWQQSRCQRLETSRPVRWWGRLRTWLGRPGQLQASAGIRADAALLRASGRFDETWYLATFADVAAAGLDPIEHYLAFGASEGRNPSPEFDSVAYMSAHPGIEATGTNPLLHVILHEALPGTSLS